MIDVSILSLQRKVAGDRDVLQQVARLWSIDPQRQSDDTTKKILMEHMQNPHAARTVWEGLSQEERLCLFHILSGGSPGRHKGITLERLQKKTKLPAQVQEGAVVRLARQWYLVDEGEIADPVSGGGPSPQRGIFPFQECFWELWRTGQELFRLQADRSTSSLRHLIGTVYGERLCHLANMCHIRLSSRVSAFSYSTAQSISDSSEVQNRVYEAMLHPLLAFDLLHQLQPWAQRLFVWLCEHKGKASMSEVRSFLAVPEEHVYSLVDTLEAHALAFDSLSSTGERWLFVPHDLLAVVQHEAQVQAEDERHFALCPLSVEHAPPPQEELPTLLYDLATIVGVSVQETIEPTKDGKIPKRMQVKIRPLLHGRVRLGDTHCDLYVDQLFEAAKELGLLKCEAPLAEEKKRYICGPEVEEWAKLSLVEQARRFLVWWPQAPSWYDLRPDGRLIPSSSSTHQKVLDHLKQCVPDHWYRVDALLYAIWRQVPLHLYDSYRRTYTKTTTLRSRRQEWIQREGETICGLLSSVLTELGLVSLVAHADASEGEKERADLFCVTAFGGNVFGEAGSSRGVESGSLDPKPVLIVQPNYELLLMQFEPRVVYQVLKFAKLERMGRISTFRLTQQALLRGLAQGLRIEHIHAFLSEHMRDKDLPQNIVYTVRDWAKAYREVQLTEVILVETSHDVSEDEFFQMIKDLRSEARKIAPTVFVVVSSGASFGDLRRRLAQKGNVVRGKPSPYTRRSER